jgi:hypothetical protein
MLHLHHIESPYQLLYYYVRNTKMLQNQTPSIPKQDVYSFWSRSNFLKLGQLYSKMYWHLLSQISVFRTIMKYIFICCAFDIIYRCILFFLYSWSNFKFADFDQNLYASYFGIEGVRVSPIWFQINRNHQYKRKNGSCLYCFWYVRSTSLAVSTGTN